MIKLSWVELNLPNNTSPGPLFGLVTSHLYMYLNEEYLIPEACIVGEIRLRQVYEEMAPEYHAWVSDYKTGQRVWIGRYKAVQDAQHVVESRVKDLIAGHEIW